MQWKFVTSNRKMLHEKIDFLKGQYSVTIRDGVTEVDVFEGTNVESVLDHIVCHMIRDTEDLVIEPVDVSEAQDCEAVLKEVMSLCGDETFYAELYSDSSSSDVLLICSHTVVGQIKSAVNETTERQAACKKIQYKTVKKPAVFLKEIEQQSFKKDWKKTYPSVEIRGNIDQEDTAEIMLQGQDDLEAALNLIHEYPCIQISFRDVKNAEHVHSQTLIPMLRDAICSIIEDEKDVVYDINEKTDKIGVCSLTPSAAEKIIQKIKKCIKCETIKRGENDQIFDDQLVQTLRGSFIERGKQYISFALQDQNTLVIYAPKSRLGECYKEVNDRLQVRARLFQENMQPLFKGEGASLASSLTAEIGSQQSSERLNCSVEIKSPVMLDLISKLQSLGRLCWKGNVEVTPIEKGGFSITGPKDEVEAITEELNEITRNARTLSIDLEIEKDNVSSFNEIAHRLGRKLPIIVKKGNTTEHAPTNSSDIKTPQERKLKWIFPNGHTVRLAEVCNIPEKKAHVVFIEDTKQSKHI